VFIPGMFVGMPPPKKNNISQAQKTGDVT